MYSFNVSRHQLNLFIFEALLTVPVFGFILGMKVIKPNHIGYVCIVPNKEKVKKSCRAQPWKPWG